VRSTWLATRALAVLTLAAGAVVAPAVASAGAGVPARPRAAEEPATDLSVLMTRLTPSAIPTRGAITISGVVQNDSSEEWSDINVAPFLSSTPITSRDELAEAADSDAAEAVGERLTDPSIAVAVGDLEPGRRASFTIRVPRAELPVTGDPGVYWIGVHALGTSVDGRDLVADGRSRTFIPLVPPELARRRTVPLSVVLPLRERARRAADGSLNGPARWVNLTESDGRLSRLADFGASAGVEPLTWLLDPAVLDALQDFGQGNPPLSLGPARRSEENGGNGEEEPDSSPSPSPSPTPITGAPDEEERTRANGVLETLLSTVRTDTVLALGYADPDVASLARRGPNLLRRSEALTASRMQVHNLTGSPVVAPPSGYFDPELLTRIRRETVMVLSDDEDVEQPPLSRLPSGQELVLTDERAVAGGPSPNAARNPLALRQRILAEAALEVAKGSEPVRPVVMSLPPRWNPGPYWREADFFGGLRVPWLRLAPIPRGATSAYDGELAYDRDQLKDEIRASNVAATRRLSNTSNVFGHLLANDNDVTDRLTGAALQASSYSAKRRLNLALEQVLALNGTARSQMNRVQVTGTDFVTLSGASGTLTVTLVNGLEQPIIVGLRARTDSPDVKVETPEPVSMQAGQRTTLRLQVASRVGVHDVTLLPVTTQGEVAGTPLTFSVRTSQVGRLIWYIIIAGGVLLAVMIVRRIVLRIRHSRWRVEEP
jgi:Family of unknown function (DUF6049)